jgi:hypothetical protein
MLALNSIASRRLAASSIAALCVATSALAGTPNQVPIFAPGGTTVVDSVMSQGGVQMLANSSANTGAPQDFMTVRFNDSSGAFTGYGVQNMNSGATAYSGNLFYDHTGALRLFQGYNNSTGEYRINNIAAVPSINFMTASTSRFFVSTAGNIGINTTAPTQKLHVNGNILLPNTLGSAGAGNLFVGGDTTAGDTGMRMFYIDSSLQGAFIDAKVIPGSNAGLLFRVDSTSGGTERMRITHTGNVGIGTTTPTQAKMVVSGTAAAGIAYTDHGFLTVNGAGNVIGSGTTVPLSLYTSASIGAPYYYAFSDERIKRVAGRSDAVRDLTTLASIEVTDYSHIDAIGKGAGQQKKVIAQQVEKVFPQAVNKGTDSLPDIYKNAPINDGWVSLATELKPGDRVRLIGKSSEGTHEVLEVADGKFRTAFSADGDQVFVYGREVKDFRMVDYEAIAMLNVSATQELNRLVQAQATMIGAQATEISVLKEQASRVALLEQDRQAQTARMGQLEQQMTQLLASQTKPASSRAAALAEEPAVRKTSVSR